MREYRRYRESCDRTKDMPPLCGCVISQAQRRHCSTAKACTGVDSPALALARSPNPSVNPNSNPNPTLTITLTLPNPNPNPNP